MKKKYSFLLLFPASLVSIPVIAISCNKQNDSNLQILNKLKTNLTIDVLNKNTLPSQITEKDIILNNGSQKISDQIKIIKTLSAVDSKGNLQVLIVLKLENESVKIIKTVSGFKKKILKSDQQIVDEALSNLQVSIKSKDLQASQVSKEMIVFSKLNPKTTLTSNLIPNDENGTLKVKIKITKNQYFSTKTIEFNNFLNNHTLIKNYAKNLAITVKNKQNLASTVSRKDIVLNNENKNINISFNLTPQDNQGQLFVNAVITKGKETHKVNFKISGFITTKQYLDNLLKKSFMHPLRSGLVLPSLIKPEEIYLHVDDLTIELGKRITYDDEKGTLKIRWTLTKNNVSSTKNVELTNFLTNSSFIERYAESLNAKVKNYDILPSKITENLVEINHEDYSVKLKKILNADDVNGKLSIDLILTKGLSSKTKNIVLTGFLNEQKYLEKFAKSLQVNVENKNVQASKITKSLIKLSSLRSDIKVIKNITADDGKGLININLLLSYKSAKYNRNIELKGFITDQQLIEKYMKDIIINVENKSIQASEVKDNLVIIKPINSEITIDKKLIANDEMGVLNIELKLTKNQTISTKNVEILGFLTDKNYLKNYANRININVADKSDFASKVVENLAKLSEEDNKITIQKQLEANDELGNLKVTLTFTKNQTTHIKEYSISGFKVKTDKQILNEYLSTLKVIVANKSMLANNVKDKDIKITSSQNALRKDIIINKSLTPNVSQGILLVELILNKNNTIVTKQFSLNGFNKSNNIPVPNSAFKIGTKTTFNISADDVLFRLKKMRDENKSFNEFLTYLRLFFKIDFMAQPNTSYRVNVDKSQASSNSLSLVLVSTKFLIPKEETFTITGFINSESHTGHGAGWNSIANPLTIGGLTFSHYVTSLGENESAESFTKLAKSKANSLTTDIQRFNFIKKYIVVSGTVDTNSEWEYYIDLGSSHAHGLYSYHMYVGATHKLTGKTFAGFDRRGRAGFTVVGWNKKKTIGELVFPVETNELGSKTKINAIKTELTNKSWDEQVSILKKYTNANWLEYDTLKSNNKLKYDYRIVMNETGTKIFQGSTYRFENPHMLHLTIEYKLKSDIIWAKKTASIDNFDIIKKVGSYIIDVRSHRSIGLYSAEEYKDEFLTPGSSPLNWENVVKNLKSNGVRIIEDASLKNKYNYEIVYNQTIAHQSTFYQAAHDTYITFTIKLTLKSDPTNIKIIKFTLEKFSYV